MPDVGSSKYPMRIEGDFDFNNFYLVAARVDEGFNRVTEASVEFVTKDRAVDLNEIVGKQVKVVMDVPEAPQRVFPGLCISAEYLGTERGAAHYHAEFRSWFWYLTRNMNCKVFQEMDAIEIFEEVLEEIGYSGDIDKRVNDIPPKRIYCVQYRETDFDFVNRLFEEEGLYYYFIQEGGVEKLVLADGFHAHDELEGGAKVVYRDYLDSSRRQIQHVSEWSKKEAATTGKLSLCDYDFESPKAELEVSSATPKGSHGHKDLEFYDYPGHYRKEGAGNRLVKIKMEAEAIRHKTSKAVGSVSNISVGRIFELDEHPRNEENGEYIVSRAVHQIRQSSELEAPLGVTKPMYKQLDWEGSGSDPYRVVFEAIPSQDQYRAPFVTKWPEISGVHTAVVVGPSGEEIYTDKYGRIKVQFHWDRIGRDDENSSLWVRCMTPWSGKAWGMIHIPRIGQEVVISFEEGDPDRPLVVGMVYNDDTMPPYELPANMTQSGMTSRSTKSGNAETFHELMFEDKIGEELVRFQSERDYKQIVKNNAEIEIGLEHTDNGDLTQTVHRHKTETLKTGDKTCTVEAGSEIRDIATDQTESIGGNRTIDIGGDDTKTIGGSQSITVGSSQEVSVGSSMDESIGSSQSTSAGQNITIEAGVKIELKVGGSSVKIDNMGVTIKGPMIEVNGSTLTQVKGGSALILKGGVTLIN